LARLKLSFKKEKKMSTFSEIIWDLVVLDIILF
jgi:hypothetical protein